MVKRQLAPSPNPSPVKRERGESVISTMLALAALSLVGLHPFTYTSLATSFDGLLHLYRLVELDHLIAQGVLFPRWAPDFVFGFGYPIFNFYAPLAYYLSAPLHWLGFTYADGATVFFVACTLLGGLSMFALAKALFAENFSAGIVAASAYIYAPTHIYDNFYRSAWGTVLAFAIIPFALWAMLKWYQTGQQRFLPMLTVAVASLMLAHNVSALLALPMIVGAAVLLASHRNQKAEGTQVNRGQKAERAEEGGEGGEGEEGREGEESEEDREGEEGKEGREGVSETMRLLRLLPPSPPSPPSAFRPRFTCVPPAFYLLLGLMLSAFFWLPAIVETAYIQTWRLTIPPDFDFHTHFLSMADWIAWPAPAEVGRINPELVNTLGPLHALLALGGSIATIYQFMRTKQADSSEHAGGAQAHRRTPTLSTAFWLPPSAFWITCLGAALYMTLPQSAWLWEKISLLASLQFPHRFLTIAAVCTAVLAAASIAVLPVRIQTPVSMCACALLIVSAIPFLYPRPLPSINPNPSLGDVLAHEHRTGALGTTASGEYFPIWVKFIPRSSTFEEAIVNGENPQRFESRSLPAGAKVLSQQAGPLSYSLNVTSPVDFRATFRHFYFPGWQGYVDDQPVQTTPSANQGFSTFEVPAGEHRIALAFTSTPPRDIGTIISLATLALGTLVTLRRSLRHFGRLKIARFTTHSKVGLRRLTSSPRRACPEPAEGWTLRWVVKRANLQRSGTLVFARPSPLVYGALGIVLLVFKVAIADQLDTPLRVTFDGRHVDGVEYARSVGLGHTITWLGYDLEGDSVTPPQTLELTLYWQAQRELHTVYSSFAHVVDEQSNLYAQKDNLHPGGAPTTTWRPHEYDVDRHHIEIPAGTPPGDYWLAIGLYNPRNGARLTREDAQRGEPLDRILIGPIHIRKAVSAPSLDQLGIQQALEKKWPTGLTLLGFALERESLPADDFLRVALFWRADAPSLAAMHMHLRLIDAQGQELASQSSEPSNNRYPTTRWSAGELVRDNRALWIPRSVPNGSYRLQLKLDSDEGWIDVATISK